MEGSKRMEGRGEDGDVFPEQRSSRDAVAARAQRRPRGPTGAVLPHESVYFPEPVPFVAEPLPLGSGRVGSLSAPRFCRPGRPGGTTCSPERTRSDRTTSRGPPVLSTGRGARGGTGAGARAAAAGFGAGSGVVEAAHAALVGKSPRTSASRLLATTLFSRISKYPFKARSAL